MKKLWILCMAVLMLMAMPLFASAADIKLQVNGQAVICDAPPYVENYRTMVPIRPLMDALGVYIKWDSANQCAMLNKDGIDLILYPGKSQAVVDGASKILDSPAVQKDGRIFVPARFVAEVFNAVVNWNEATQTVQIQFAAPPKERSFVLTGYYYDADSATTYFRNREIIDTVVHFDYSFTVDGHVVQRKLTKSDEYDSIKSTSDYYGTEEIMLVTGFYSYIVDAIVQDPAKRAIAVQDLIRLMNEGGYDGIDLDIEAMSDGSRDGLVSFVYELKAAMGDKTLTMSLIPKVSDKQTWLDKYDYATLASICDRIHLMFYNQHYDTSAPGPTAGLDWLQQGLEYMLKLIPKEKLIVGLGCFGHDWYTVMDKTQGGSVRIVTARERAEQYNAEIKRDEVSGVPYFSYYKPAAAEVNMFRGEYTETWAMVPLQDKDGNTYYEWRAIPIPVINKEEAMVDAYHEVWFEDAISMAAKAELATKYDVAGIALWRLGYIPDDILSAIIDVCQQEEDEIAYSRK